MPLATSPTRLALLAALLAGTVLARVAQADVLVEGYKGVSHELRVEGLDRHPDLSFVLFPMFRGGVAVVSSDRPLPYIKWSSPRLYAISRAQALPERVDEGWLRAHAVAVSWHEFRQENQIPEDRPEASIRTVFRVAGIEGRKLVIEGVREELFDRAGARLEERVPALHESDPDAKEDERPVAPPRDRRGSWAPGRLGEGLFAALPVVAALGLLGMACRRRRLPAAGLAVAALVCAAAVARADIPIEPREAAPRWLVAGGLAALALGALAVVLYIRRSSR